MAKRIYPETVKRWMIGAGIVGVPLAIGIILYLVYLNAIMVTGYTGDIICAGTQLEPCEAIINFTAKTDIFVYPSNDTTWAFGTDHPLKSLEIYRSWGTGWRKIDFSKGCTGTWCGKSPTDKRDEAVFSYAFRSGKNYTLKFVGYKNSPYDTIKWSFGKVDPSWIGISPAEISIGEDLAYSVTFDNITFISYNNPTCSWNQSTNRTCELVMEVSYNKAIPLIVKGTNFANTMTNATNLALIPSEYTLTRGVNQSFIYSFNYPPNAGEHFNVSFTDGVNDWIIDPDIDACSLITSSGTYTLTNDIIDTTVTNCFTINVSNVLFDGQYHLIDGNGINAQRAFYLYSSVNFQNTTIYNAKTTDMLGACIRTTYSSSGPPILIKNIIMNNCEFGIYYGSNAVFDNLTISGMTDYGIDFLYTENATVRNSNISHNLYGIRCGWFSGGVVCSNNTFENLTIAHNGDAGIALGWTTKNATRNTFRNIKIINHTHGIDFYNGMNNTFYNIFFNNTINVYHDNAWGTLGKNDWNTTKQVGDRIFSYGTEIGGNWWSQTNGSSYSRDCADADKDGFCDAPYTLYTNNADYLPYSDEYPSFSECTEINSPGVYLLNADIDNSGISYCMNISANNVTLDCQNYLIDGDGDADYGIWISRESNQDTNIIIQNCKLTDWDSAVIINYNANSNTFKNLVIKPSSTGIVDSIWIERSHSSYLKDIIITSSNYGVYLYYSNLSNLSSVSVINSGIESASVYLDHSHYNTLDSITAKGNGNDGVYFEYSDSNTLKNSRIENNSDFGIWLNFAGASGPNKFYNNLFNNTNNIMVTGTFYPNLFNTTKASGTRIIGPGLLGGNYWSNFSSYGYSETCIDANEDYFCDSPLNLSNNMDWIPYSVGNLKMTIINPKNDTVNTTNNNDFYYRLNDGLSATCHLKINGVINKTASSLPKNTMLNLTTYLPIGDYSWRLNCSDEVTSLESENRTIFIRYDLNASIYPGTSFYFIPVSPNQNATEPYGQNDSVPIIIVMNNQSSAINLQVKVNATHGNITLKMVANNTLTSPKLYNWSQVIQTSFVTIYTGVAVNQTIYVWAYADYAGAKKIWRPELDLYGL